MKNVIFSVLFLLSLSAYADVYNSEHYQRNHIAQLAAFEKGQHFFVLGDWGRNGHFYQRDVAKWMDIAAYQIDPDFITTTGDNFYDNGIASIQDPYWVTAFENIYHGPHLFVDWYPTLGNHDYRGNWQAQIDYSDVSRRWQMPEQYYAKTTVLKDGTEILYLFIDTSPLNPAYKNEAKYAETQKQDAAKQLHWITQQLATTTADWKVVIGHHPLYSSGKRFGKTSEIQQVLEPILEKYQVDAYFAGHEHDMQHNKPQHTTVDHFISGGGSEVRPVAQRKFTKFAKATGGFAAVAINKKALLVQFIDHQGKIIYRYKRNKAL
ncbi:tartrate-resistant acid phosphatase type 5 family protein [Thalassotalea sp. PP2-459]|uniref:purple acid phosphatase family protein n=1 Tax=Thalassotalea sp. PP2-459 TaxID=1742724 RepID=UPI0009421AE5|nr:tartrate-resistant acid phosphatase type 5 family protein [Thalassotalea sp. PP2-459]OKY26689.1 acid phosphatase [Thalassotalea sp. PP2-459]